MIKLLIIGMLLSSCGPAEDVLNDFVKTKIDEKTPDPRSGNETSAELLPYVEDFANLLVEHELGSFLTALTDIPVWLTDITKKPKIGSRVVGLCHSWSSATRKFREISVDRTWFEEHQDDTEALRQLVEHELGHCLLDRDHLDLLDEDYNPVSIMYPYVFNGSHYEENHTYYIKELFGKLKDSCND